MITDEHAKKTNNKEIIEVLVENMWFSSMSVDLRLLGRDDLKKVTAVRVRSLEEEI